MALGLTLEKMAQLSAQSRQERSVLKRAVEGDLQESPGAAGRLLKMPFFHNSGHSIIL